MITTPNLNATIHTISKKAMEQYFYELGITARPLPEMASIDDQVLSGAWKVVRTTARGVARIAKRALAARRPAGRGVSATAQAAAAK